MARPLVGVVGHLDGVRQRAAKVEEALAVLAALGDLVEPALGLLDLRLRRVVDGAVVGAVDDVLADHDELAADREVVDRAPVVVGVDDRRGVRREPAEVLRHREVGVDRFGVLEERPSVIVACLPAWISFAAVS